MRVFKTKRFAKWAKKEKLTDMVLCQAVHEMEKGLIDAQLGEHIYKKRVAPKGRGKRGSFRTILAYQVADKAFFIFGFSKNRLENVNQEQLSQLTLLSSLFISYADSDLQRALDENELIEVFYHE